MRKKVERKRSTHSAAAEKERQREGQGRREPSTSVGGSERERRSPTTGRSLGVASQHVGSTSGRNGPRHTPPRRRKVWLAVVTRHLLPRQAANPPPSNLTTLPYPPPDLNANAASPFTLHTTLSPSIFHSILLTSSTRSCIRDHPDYGFQSGSRRPTGCEIRSI